MLKTFYYAHTLFVYPIFFPSESERTEGARAPNSILNSYLPFKMKSIGKATYTMCFTKKTPKSLIYGLYIPIRPSRIQIWGLFSSEVNPYGCGPFKALTKMKGWVVLLFGTRILMMSSTYQETIHVRC